MGTGTSYLDTQGRFWRKTLLPVAGMREMDLAAQMVLIDRDGRRVDSLPVPGRRSRAGLGFVLMTSEGIYSLHPIDSLYALGRDGAMALASPTSYRVRIERRGEPPLEVARDVPAVPYERDERAEWEAAQKPFVRGLRFDDLG